MRIDLPDVNFTIGVDYPDDDGWVITISLGDVPLISRNYTVNREAVRTWRLHTGNKSGYPHWWAADVNDAKEKCITEFGHELKRALSAGSALTPIGGTI